MNKHHHMIRWWLYVILLQIIGGAIGFFVIYHNYQSITKSASIKEHYSKTFSFWSHKKTAVHTSAPEVNLLSWSISPQLYSWMFWFIEYWERTIWTDYNNRNIRYESIKINTELHDSAIYVIWAFKKELIDSTIANYLIRIWSNISIFEQSINDLNFLTKYTWLPIITSPEQNIRNQLDDILSLKEKETKINKLIWHFSWLEEETKSILSSNKKTPWTNNLLVSEKFAYIYNMIHVDKNIMYKKHITNASEIFWIKPNTIKACIIVEQLRAFYTFKGLFKNISQTNKYLTVMSQQSFGIGWIKLTTAEKLEQWLQQAEPDLYKNYFAYTNANNINQQRMARLTDTKNYYYQILYTAWILYWYQSERAKAWYDISYNPWILATMYNIGYSKPHGAADIWGSSLKIEWETYSFWWLAMLVYYYLEIFW